MGAQVGPYRSRAIEEELGGIGWRQRIERVLLLAGKAEPRATRDENLEVGRERQEGAHLGSRRQQMLEVVEHQQRVPAAKLLQLAHSGGERDRRGDERRLLNRREGNEDDTPAGVVDQPGSDLQCQPRLAAPARTRHRDETRAAGQHAAQLGQLPLATDEARALLG